MEKQYYIVKRSDDTLSHAQKGQERSNHKYVKREWKGDRWQYWYKDDKGNLTTNKPTVDPVTVKPATVVRDPNATNITITDNTKSSKSKFSQLFDKGKESISKLFSSAVTNISETIDKGKNFIDQKVEAVERAHNNDKRNERREAERTAQYEKEHEEWLRNDVAKKAFKRTDNMSEEEHKAVIKEHQQKTANSYKGPENVKQQRQDMISRDWEERRLNNPNRYQGPESAKEAKRSQEKKEARQASVQNMMTAKLNAEKEKQDLINAMSKEMKRLLEEQKPENSAGGTLSTSIPKRAPKVQRQQEELIDQWDQQMKDQKDQAERAINNEKRQERQKNSAKASDEEKRQVNKEAVESMKNLGERIVNDASEAIDKAASKAAKDAENYKDPRVKTAEKIADILTQPVKEYTQRVESRIATEKFVNEQLDKLTFALDTKIDKRHNSRRR